MTDLVELDNQPSTSRDTNVEDIPETRPLLNAINHEKSILEYIFLLCLALILITGVSIGVYLLFVEDEDVVPDKLVLVLREHWNAQPDLLNISKLVLPIQRVLLLQTNSSRCWNETECCRVLRSLLKQHVELLNEPDILYNFVVGDDGRVYEGRGWEYQSSYLDSDEEVLTVAFLGNYDELPPSHQQTEQLKIFLDYAVMKKYLTPCYKMLVLNSPMRYFSDIALRIEENVKIENKC